LAIFPRVEGDRAIEERLKHLLVQRLSLVNIKPQDIGDDEPLFGEGVGLDSLDGVEIAVILQREFGIRVTDRNATREAFATVRTLADFIRSHQKNGKPPSPA
jgi:acyl carrier protein